MPGGLKPGLAHVICLVPGTEHREEQREKKSIPLILSNICGLTVNVNLIFSNAFILCNKL